MKHHCERCGELHNTTWNNPCSEFSAREAKLELHDENAQAALDKIGLWLKQEPRLLIAIARGRHAEGSLRYGDRLMYEYSQDELLAEASQELGDAINYLALYLAREEAQA